MRPNRYLVTLVFAFTCALGAATTAFANDTMDVLVAGKQLKVTTASGASFTVAFDANGQYSTSTGSSGTWTMSGDTLCTLKVGEAVESCGILPSGKIAGDSWQTTDGNGNSVTATIA